MASFGRPSIMTERDKLLALPAAITTPPNNSEGRFRNCNRLAPKCDCSEVAAVP